MRHDKYPGQSACDSFGNILTVTPEEKKKRKEKSSVTNKFLITGLPADC
jgi:hypothetical protein